MLKLRDNKEILTRLNDYVNSFCLSQLEDNIEDRLYMMNLSSMEFRIEIDDTNRFYQFGIRAINILISLNLEPVTVHNMLFIELNVHNYKSGIYFCLKSIDVNSDFSIFNLNEEMAHFAINLVELNKNKSTLSLENFSIEDIEKNDLDISNYKSISCNSWQVYSLNKCYSKQLVIICSSVSRVRFLIKDINKLFSMTDRVCFYVSDSYRECKSVLSEVDKLYYKSKLKYGKERDYVLKIRKRLGLYFCEFMSDCMNKLLRRINI